MLYYSLVYPYSIVSLFGAEHIPQILKRIILLQKRAVRCINKTAYDAQTDPIFKELNILKFNDILLLNLGKFIYLIVLMIFLLASIRYTTITHEVLNYVLFLFRRAIGVLNSLIC